jgi:hypothetical protein
MHVEYKSANGMEDWWIKKMEIIDEKGWFHKT